MIIEKRTIALIIFIGLTGWLGWDRINGTTTDLSPYIKQISELSKVVANLQVECRK